MSPTMWGALKATAKMLGLRKPTPAVDPQFTRPQGLYDPDDVDLKKLGKLIKHGKLAPCYPGRESADEDVPEDQIVSEKSFEASPEKKQKERHANARETTNPRTHDSIASRFDECPICFLCYPCLNNSRCCSSAICTECYLRVASPSNAPEVYDRRGRRVFSPPKCPFCKTPAYDVVYTGAKTASERAEEAEERRALARALEAARNAALEEQRERRARRESFEAARIASVSNPLESDGTHPPGSSLASPGTPTRNSRGDAWNRDAESGVGSPVPVGWEAEYAALTPPRRDASAFRRSDIGFGWSPSTDPAPFLGMTIGNADYGRSSGRPRARSTSPSMATRDLEEESRRRATRRRESQTESDPSWRRSPRRAFLPPGSAFLPRRANPELFTADHGHRSHGFGLGRRGGPASESALDRERSREEARDGEARRSRLILESVSETMREFANGAASAEQRIGDERRMLREISRRAEDSRRERELPTRIAERGDGTSVDAADPEETFLARACDFIPARLWEASFGDISDWEGEISADVASRRALDMDDAMMLEAVRLSLQDQRENRREEAEVSEAIALVAAAEAAEAAARAERVGGERVDVAHASLEPEGNDANDAKETTLNDRGPGEVATGTRTFSEGTFISPDAFGSISIEYGDESDCGLDATDASLAAALEAEADRITAHRLSSFNRETEEKEKQEEQEATEKKEETTKKKEDGESAETPVAGPSAGAAEAEIDDTACVDFELENALAAFETESVSKIEADTETPDPAAEGGGGADRTEPEPEPEPDSKTEVSRASDFGAGAGPGAGAEPNTPRREMIREMDVAGARESASLDLPDVPRTPVGVGPTSETEESREESPVPA